VLIAPVAVHGLGTQLSKRLSMVTTQSCDHHF